MQHSHTTKPPTPQTRNTMGHMGAPRHIPPQPWTESKSRHGPGSDRVRFPTGSGAGRAPKLDSVQVAGRLAELHPHPLGAPNTSSSVPLTARDRQDSHRTRSSHHRMHNYATRCIQADIRFWESFPISVWVMLGICGSYGFGVDVVSGWLHSGGCSHGFRVW